MPTTKPDTKTAHTHIVIRDCGYGRVWTRNASSYEDAERVLNDWRKTDNGVGFQGGDFSIEPASVEGRQS